MFSAQHRTEGRLALLLACRLSVLSLFPLSAASPQQDARRTHGMPHGTNCAQGRCLGEAEHPVLPSPKFLPPHRTAVPSAALPPPAQPCSIPPFSCLFFSPSELFLYLPYAVIITNDNFTAALLFRAQQSRAPPPFLPPTAPGQRLGPSTQGFL